ncbi:hypothetical protein KTO58_15745 [Chitinophaga pendula]|uniref:hypothetical protein n=1 Tax=Chitinophaga TaxID=79328 RepID=UPI0012FDA078|nr:MULTISPECIES: hypothetical protein [Chitinophaga]UCJ05147.1 hypothetical protein KTO58_15745 [Chitinophaga pendula]
MKKEKSSKLQLTKIKVANLSQQPIKGLLEVTTTNPTHPTNQTRCFVCFGTVIEL